MARYLLACSLAVFAARGAFAVPQQLSLVFQANTISIAGITPAAEVYAYGLAREASGGFVSVVPRAIVLRDDDRDGRVAWPLDVEIPLRSVWMAVDMSSGAYVAGSPDGYPSTRVQLSDQHLKKDFGSEVAQLAFEGMLVDFIVVRPGTGAWRGMGGLRGPDDEGTDEDKVTLSVLKLKAAEGTSGSAPAKLKKGDVVFVVDSFRGAYGIAQIGEGQ